MFSHALLILHPQALHILHPPSWLVLHPPSLLILRPQSPHNVVNHRAPVHIQSSRILERLGRGIRFPIRGALAQMGIEIARCRGARGTGRQNRRPTGTPIAMRTHHWQPGTVLPVAGTACRPARHWHCHVSANLPVRGTASDSHRHGHGPGSLSVSASVKSSLKTLSLCFHW